MKNLDNRLDLKIVVPTPEEQKFIKSIPGFTTGGLLNKWMRKENQDRNTGKLWTWSLHYGFHPGPDMPTDVMYQIYKVWIERAESDLAAVNSLLKTYAEDPLGVQIAGISEISEIPVHPGVAKYLKEKGVWKSSWIVGTLKAGVK
jgi:hypothetical protein